MAWLRNSGIWFALAALLLLPATAMAKGEKTDPDDAKQYIEVLGKEALGILGDNSVDLATRESKVRGLMEENLDLPLLGRFVLGRHWRGASPEQQEEYLALFEEFVLQTYTRRLGGYSGQSFSVTSARPVGKRGDALVDTEITEQGTPPIKAGWRVKTTKGQKRIVDVMVEGTSMAATQRSEFDAIVRRDGVDGLIEVLRVKVTKAPAQS